MGGGGEKTEKATAKKRRDARRKGQVRRSTEVNTALCAIVMFGLFFAIFPWYVDQMVEIFREHLGTASITQASNGMNTNEVLELLGRVMLGLFGVIFPLLGTAIFIGIAANILQVGFMFTTETMKVKFSKLNPINGFKQMLSPKKLVDLTKNILKIVVVGYVAYSDYVSLMEKFSSYVGQDIYTSFIDIMRTAFIMALKMCLVMVFIAIADFLYQWWKYEKDLKMSKQEVKDEYKMMEGDPKIKAKIRQKQMQMSAMRMMSSVPEADVVITNPTHYAVALKYDDKVSSAPTVIAKGQDYIALKMREVAMEHGIEIVENPPLAQSLYAMCEIDDEIPEDLYQAVADILVFVFKQKGKIPA
ncbi:MAG: flagellar biosynthesis protein FlhB [Oscillospiraceae bacterium]|jgi:flagellar biosynthetic protein FlhB|nr:flagellar biosynthesis protein FlhB [Oscillospiraceae bacterium]